MDVLKGLEPAALPAYALGSHDPQDKVALALGVSIAISLKRIADILGEMLDMQQARR